MSDDGRQELPTEDSLKRLPVEQLVALIVQQQRVIARLQQEVERLKVSAALDSQTSSKPPSSDLLKQPTTAKPESEEPKTAFKFC